MREGTKRDSRESHNPNKQPTSNKTEKNTYIERIVLGDDNLKVGVVVLENRVQFRVEWLADADWISLFAGRRHRRKRRKAIGSDGCGRRHEEGRGDGV